MGKVVAKTWSDNEQLLLGNLIEAGFTNKEIAKMMNRSLVAVRIKSQRYYSGNKNGKTKHAHLREKVLTYFLNNSAEETKKHFNLTDSEFKSLMTVAYGQKSLRHLRKDERNKRPWMAHHYKILLQNAGIKPRSWIAKKIGKGNVNSCIKERLEKLGIASRTFNGLTLTSYGRLFGKNPRKFLKTNAGPGRGKHAPTFFKIVPWVEINKDLKDKYVETTNLMKLVIDARAQFQNWIFDGEYKSKIEKKLRAYK